MKNLITNIVILIMMLLIGTPVYLVSYVFLILIWQDAHVSEPIFTLIFYSVVLTFLIGLNYIFVGRRFKNSRREQLIISILMVPLIFFALYIALVPRGNDFRNCGMYTKELEGGQKIFRGKEYTIEFCGLLNYFQSPNNNKDEVRLRVYSKEGELLAVRYFQPLSGPTRIPNTEYGDSYLMYNGEGDDYNTVLVMPPSQWEWIKARMPRIFP